jgi:hypothetical protein
MFLLGFKACMRVYLVHKTLFKQSMFLKLKSLTQELRRRDLKKGEIKYKISGVIFASHNSAVNHR